MDELEFWIDDHPRMNLKSSMQPQVGDLISINKVTYEVASRNFAVDYHDQPGRCVRLICNLEKV